MQLGDFNSWLADVQRQASQFANRAESYIVNALVNFRDKRGELNWQLSKLRANPPLASAPDALRQHYRDALTLAEDAKTKADWLGKIADTFTNITGLGAIPAVVAGVGVPVMLAAIASLVIVITKVTSAVTHYLNARQVAEAADKEGKSPTDALNKYYRANPSGGGGIVSDLFAGAGGLVWPVAITLGLYLLATGNKRR